MGRRSRRERNDLTLEGSWKDRWLKPARWSGDRGDDQSVSTFGHSLALKGQDGYASTSYSAIELATSDWLTSTVARLYDRRAKERQVRYCSVQEISPALAAAIE
jgi:hypothetical protein